MMVNYDGELSPFMAELLRYVFCYSLPSFDGFQMICNQLVVGNSSMKAGLFRVYLGR